MELDYLWTGIILSVFGFGITFYLIPRIISVVVYKEILDEPNYRSSHTTGTPNLGGIAFFISLSVGLFGIYLLTDNDAAYYITPGLILLFVIGLKDDLVVLGHWSKFIAQFLATTFLCFHQEFQHMKFHGFLGMHEIDFIWTVVISVFIALLVINALNFIDGIDGMASMTGMVFFGALAYESIRIDDYFAFGFALLCFGTLLGFLPFNLSKGRKIFMGDTGSLIIGYAITIGILLVLNKNTDELQAMDIYAKNKLFVLAGMFFIPLFDISRVVVGRISRGKNPFKADRTHIHHILLDGLNLSHFQTSFILALVGLAIYFVVSLLSGSLDMLRMFIVVLLIYAVLLIGIKILQKKRLIAHASK